MIGTPEITKEVFCHKFIFELNHFGEPVAVKGYYSFRNIFHDGL
jgi:hypothetical protein